MTVSSALNRISFAGNGSTTAFATSPVVFFDAADLDVYVVVDSTGVATLKTITTHYTVTGGDGSTGTVTMLTAPVSGETLLIVRTMDATQVADFVQNDPSDAEVAEDALDKLTMLVQQLDERLDRVVTIPISETGTDANSILPFDRASKFLSFDGSKNILASVGTDGGTPTSAFMATVLDDTTAAAARTTLDVPSNAEAILDAIFDAKGDLIVATAADTPARVAVGAQGHGLVADSAAAAGVSYTHAPVFKNRLYNGAWRFDQVNEGGLYTSSSGFAIQASDGWTIDAVGAGVYKVRRVADPDFPSLFALEVTCTTADASIASTDLYAFRHNIEGYDVADLLAGTASAKQITVSFDMKFSVTGTYGVRFVNSALNRSFVGTVTQNIANTRESKTITLTLDTAGTWLYTNGTGLGIAFTLAAGSNYQTTAGSWQAGDFYTTSSQVNFMSSVSNIGYIGRIQLEKGSVATEFEEMSYEADLARCQRYYNKTFPIGVAVAQAAGSAGVAASDYTYAAGAGVVLMWQYPSRMRAISTITTYNPTQANANWRNASDTADANRSTSINNEWGAILQGDTNTVSGTIYHIHATANARLS